MPISRRIFLRAGTMVVLGAAAQSKLAKVVVGQKSGGLVDAVSGFRVPAASMDDPLTYYTKSTFLAHLNSKFRLRRGDLSSSVVTLIKVVDNAPSQSKVAAQVGSSECFALIFSGGKRLPQDTYTVEHGALGTFKLLLVPSGKPGGVPQWDAVINRLYS
jgi:hypothetical protein